MKATIITLTLLISLSLYFIGNNSIKNEKQKISQKRMLLNHDETNKICSKATYSFRKKYSLINSEEKEDIKLTDNDKKFIAFLRDEKLSTVTKYLKWSNNLNPEHPASTILFFKGYPKTRPTIPVDISPTYIKIERL